MLRWAKQQLADVAGTEEPIYGPSAIQPVTNQTPPWTQLTKEDLKWRVQDGTNVEVQAFYFTTDDGHLGLAQILYSNVMGIRKTSQFNSKIIYPGQKFPPEWCTDPVDDYGWSNNRWDIHAKGVSITLSEDGNTYTIKSTVNKDCIIDATMTRLAPGVVAGKDGTSFYGTDPTKPWGTMRHAFWPRCKASGTFKTKTGTINMAGKGLFVNALQGMKPHHGAASWDFVDYQGPKYSAICMAFTTPASYGYTRVVVGAIATDTEILHAGADCRAERTKTVRDPQSKCDEPTAYRFTWGKAGETESSALLEGSWGNRLDRIDIMEQLPGFVKSIVVSAAGTEPYIYQYAPEGQLILSYKGQDIKETGRVFGEATFISAVPQAKY